MSKTKPSTMNRRKFVGLTAASAFTFTYLPSRVFGANERVHVAGIGVGGKGSSDVSGAAGAGAEIVALCDVDHRRAANSFKKYPKAKQFEDFRVMLEKQKDIDAVTVSTPDHTHAPAAVMAMKMGKHVYCQKPLTHSIYEARLLTKTAKETGVITQMGNQAHAGEPIRRAVELVRAGIIGKVREAHIWTNRPIWPQGLNRPAEIQEPPAGLNWDLWLGPAPFRPYHGKYLPFSWRGWWDFGTGALGDMACHIMDMAYWSLDLKYPTAVEAVSGGGTLESPPNWATITYQFPSRNSNPPVKLVWYDGKKDGKQNYPPENILDGVAPKNYGSILVGDKGKLYFNRGNTNWLIKPDSALDGFKEPSKSIPRVRNEDHEWISAIKGEGHAPLSGFEFSGPFTEVVLLGNVAIRTGKKLQWDGEAMKATNAPEAAQYVKREYRPGWFA